MRNMGKALAYVGVGLITFILYIAFVGSLEPTDLVFAIVISCVVAALVGGVVVEHGGKLFSLRRLGYLIAYAIHYLLIVEVKAHAGLIKRIITGEVKPAIVKVPYGVKTDYALLMVANSITNTPGTVVVDVDEGKRVMYVHWIFAKTLEPKEAREYVSKLYEKYASKVLD